jgi:riboflavin biosynthesis pyrimidine reductase
MLQTTPRNTITTSFCLCAVTSALILGYSCEWLRKRMKCVCDDAHSEFAQASLRAKGVEVVEFDFLSPAAVADYCYERGFLQLLWECGGTLAAPAIAGNVIHKLMVFVAPKIVRERFVLFLLDLCKEYKIFSLLSFHTIAVASVISVTSQ